MGRKTFGAKITWKLKIPEEVALPIEIMFYDKVTGKPNYGARSHLVTTLLQKYLMDCKTEGNT